MLHTGGSPGLCRAMELFMRQIAAVSKEDCVEQKICCDAIWRLRPASVQACKVLPPSCPIHAMPENEIEKTPKTGVENGRLSVDPAKAAVAPKDVMPSLNAISEMYADSSANVSRLVLLIASTCKAKMSRTGAHASTDAHLVDPKVKPEQWCSAIDIDRHQSGRTRQPTRSVMLSIPGISDTNR